MFFILKSYIENIFDYLPNIGNDWQGEPLWEWGPGLKGIATKGPTPTRKTRGVSQCDLAAYIKR
jgi:hypothetical protein